MARTTSPETFQSAYRALPAQFRLLHRPPAERDDAQIAAWLNQLHRDTEQATQTLAAQASRHLAAGRPRQAAAAITAARPYRQVMRCLDVLAARRRRDT